MRNSKRWKATQNVEQKCFEVMVFSGVCFLRHTPKSWSWQKDRSRHWTFCPAWTEHALNMRCRPLLKRKMSPWTSSAELSDTRFPLLLTSFKSLQHNVLKKTLGRDCEGFPFRFVCLCASRSACNMGAGTADPPTVQPFPWSKQDETSVADGTAQSTRALDDTETNNIIEVKENSMAKNLTRK